MSLVVLIPAYQPGPDLPALVRAILAETSGVVDRAVVVNDGSAERCAPVFAEVADSREEADARIAEVLA